MRTILLLEYALAVHQPERERMATICLNMIVRDESPVIGRCLASVLPFIDRWVVVDTGSADGTQARVRDLLGSKPGEIYERPWKNFGHNRTEALELARGTADYLFFIDADERLALPEGFDRAELTADGYYIRCEYAGMSYARCALVAARLPWRWEGAVHEFLTCDRAFALDTLRGPAIVVAHDGARSWDPFTYHRDAALLEEALRANPNDARSAFYLAQSNRDAGELSKSRELYRRRAEMGGWDEEVWFALYQVAAIDERLGAPAADVAAGYLRAFQCRPTRAEPLVQLARFNRERGDLAVAYLYARHAATIPKPADLLFVDEAVYGWRALDELSILAFYVGRPDEGRAAWLRLVSENQFPEKERVRIVANGEFYRSA
jgi:hypothetical protein